MGLYTGGLVFGIVRVLVNWWAYTWGGGAYIWGGLYSEVYGMVNMVGNVHDKLRK